MKAGPAQTLLGFAISALIAWMHSQHIWPFNSLLNECIVAVIAVIVLILCMRDKA
jgi:hypothetical protein